MEKYRNGPEWQSVVARREIRRCGNLRYIELAVTQEPPVTRRGIHIRQDRQIHAIDFDLLFYERADNLIVATGERKRDFLQHSKLFCTRTLVSRRQGGEFCRIIRQAIAAPHHMEVGP